MKYQVMISDKAEKDLRSTYEYIAFELLSPGNAGKQLTRLEQAIETLEAFPKRHRSYEIGSWIDREIRVFPGDNYCIFYHCNDEEYTVTIIRVMYSGRDIFKQITEKED